MYINVYNGNVHGMVHVAAAAINIIFGKVAGELSLKVVKFRSR